MAREWTKTDAAPFELSGDAVCLDFVNTLADRPRGNAERLHGYADLLAFARAADLVSERERRALAAEARRRPVAARRSFARAVALREALYRLLGAERRAGAADVARLRDAAAKAAAHRRLVHGRGGWRWEWDGALELDRPLWSIARSAAELVTSSDLDAVRECGGETCSWLFLDRSRAGTRRWCDMKTCGNRAKARRHYARRKAARGE